MKTQTAVFIQDKDIAWEFPDTGIRRKVMAYNDQLMLVRVDFEQGAIGTLHKHYHTQISHVESGVFEVEVAGQKKILRAGDAFNVPSDVIHGVVCLEAGVLIDIFNPCREDFIK
jgi:quercetin dioxygenase-like cupin family protein